MRFDFLIMTKKSQTIKQKKVMNFTTLKKESLFNKDTVDENGGDIFFPNGQVI